jgi:hypothetical protein
MKYLLPIVTCVFIYVANASATDHAGKFAMKGAGLLPCSVYLTERESESKVYYLIGGWIEGYMSAYNKHTADTFDITSFESLELMLLLIKNHCESHPSDRLHGVLDGVFVKLAPHRTLTENELVIVSDAERSTSLYRDTVRRIQLELTRRGLYKGEVDGHYNEGTKSALIAFQSDIRFDKTGFPDQASLWRLLRKE